MEAMESCSELFCNKSLTILVWHHFDLFDDIKFHFHDVISMTLDGVMSFSRMKNLQNTCKRLYYSQRFWQDGFSCNGGKLVITEGYTCLFVVFVC